MIIGAGIAGIAAAIRLARNYRVIVLEKNSFLGGKLSEICLQDFRFDAGPSLFTLPELVEELFEICGESAKDFFTYQKLPIICKYFYPDGTILFAYANIENFVDEIAQKLGESPEDVKRFLQKAERIYKITKPVFLEKSLHQFSTYLSLTTLRSLLLGYEIDAFRTMHQANKSMFRNPKTVQFFDRYATYNGSNPYQAPATLNVISHLEHCYGAFFPHQGMYSLAIALTKLAKKRGVEFLTQTEAQKIIVRNSRAIAVQTNSQTIECDYVISNADIMFTYRKLLSEHKAPEHILKQPRSSSALIFYWGINRQFSELELHNIFFSQDYQKEFEAIFQQKTIADDVTVYVFISSKIVFSDAPKDCENWFVMINVPPNSGQNWDELIVRARQSIVRKINAILNTDIEKLIVVESVLDPRKIEERTSSYGGALYGNSSNTMFSAFLRHPNFSKKISNLYFCGGSVHPGGGIPLCMLSAKIATSILMSKDGFKYL